MHVYFIRKVQYRRNTVNIGTTAFNTKLANKTHCTISAMQNGHHISTVSIYVWSMNNRVEYIGHVCIDDVSVTEDCIIKVNIPFEMTRKSDLVIVGICHHCPSAYDICKLSHIPECTACLISWWPTCACRWEVTNIAVWEIQLLSMGSHLHNQLSRASRNFEILLFPFSNNIFSIWSDLVNSSRLMCLSIGALGDL